MTLTATLGLRAQTLEAHRHWQQKKLPNADTLHVDTLSLLPGSVQVEGISAHQYQIDHAHALLIWHQKPNIDSVTLRYRRLQINLGKTYAHKSGALVKPLPYLAFDPPVYVYRPGSGGLLQSDDVNYTGSYARSLSLGNNQDVVLNSNFNFQVSGYILDSIRIEAAITDNTIPFQPQGNTQRIQEFDQIYIRLSKKQHLLQVGDYNLERPKGYFINYFKRVQGLYFQTAMDNGRSFKNSTGISASVAKGQFARNIFDGVEGNQGPYRLAGNNGEQFFIVLAGTEKVFIDNVPMQRGENADYVIDYNTGELLFMPRRMISKDTRIQVEFEYQDRNYLNSLLYGYNELELGKKWNVRINAYSNQDAKNQSYLQTLNGPQKLFLATIGDSIQNAYYPGILPDSFAANKVLYKMTDSLVGSILYDSVFVYSTHPDSAKYSLAFSFVGEGKGNYVLQVSNANGRVYTWRAPINGKRQGNYEPVILLITPKKHQLFSLITSYQVDSLKTVQVELAGSNYDPNLFSTKDNQNHFAGALRAVYQEQRFLGKKDTLQRQPFSWQNTASYEWVKENFRAIAPYRNVEFTRDWSVPSVKTDEHLASFQSALAHQNGMSALYNFGLLHKERFYEGQKHLATLQYKKGTTKILVTYNQLFAQDTLRHIRFSRPVAEAVYGSAKTSWPEIGARYAIEDHRVSHLKTDTLLNASFWFSTASAWLSAAPRSPLKWHLKYYTRNDKLPRHNRLVPQSHSQNWDATLSLTDWKNQSLTFVGTYRKLVIDDTTFNKTRPQESMVGRMDYSASFLKNMITLRTLYEVGNGQEQKRSYTYVEVPAGQGHYQWIDYNGDGVQQANEFELALYADQKRFIRIIVPTNEYVKVNFINFNQSLAIEPSAWMRKGEKNFFKKTISLFSAQLNAQVSNRILAVEGMKVFIPFTDVKNANNIIAASSLLNQTLFFNRLNARWGADYNFNVSRNKMLLTYGIETYTQEQQLLKARYNAPASLTFGLSLIKGKRGFQSPLNDNRSYAIALQAIEPSFTWLRKAMLRITTTYRYENKDNNATQEKEHATIQSGTIDVRWSQPSAGVVQLKGTLTQIAYSGAPNESVAFNMLESLQPGQNFLWVMNWQRSIGRGIELSIDYEGRKMQAHKVIHTGRMTLRAIL